MSCITVGGSSVLRRARAFEAAAVAVAFLLLASGAAFSCAALVLHGLPGCGSRAEHLNGCQQPCGRPISALRLGTRAQSQEDRNPEEGKAKNPLLRRLFAALGIFGFFWARPSPARAFDAVTAVATKTMVDSAKAKSVAWSANALAAAVTFNSARQGSAPVRDDECVIDADSLPAPDVPGLAEANLVVKVATEPGVVPVSPAGKVNELMEEASHEILRKMGRDGWEVRLLDSASGACGVEGDFEILLPAVDVEMPMATVSIPAPRFAAHVRDAYPSGVSGDYQERLQADLVLQNGEDILTVELRFPFRGKFSISAAGWARARVGRQGDSVRVAADVELGLHVPKVPGLTPVLQHFVKNYANASAFDCATALSKPDQNS
eukprot:TRINITY_DN78644_c0_g1_i1.p1 TRINITY_DN78644_c0_g1~~TRINITY_DN78644_c0_g1_i1.p1  ORF type:complete len:378 (+),score=69.37 TRINITY_DN78644_c0_g1_i1:57-1190(+)